MKDKLDDQELYDQFVEYKAQHTDLFHNSSVSLERIVFDDSSSYHEPFPELDAGLDWVYTIQHQVVFRWFTKFLSVHPKLSELPAEHYPCFDVGSQTQFVAMMASFVNYIQLDASMCSPKGVFRVADSRLAFRPGEAQNLSFPDNSFLWITSLHAIEHFGLGRYRDTIDPEGDIRGLKEIYRVLKPGGYFVGAVPIVKEGTERIQFNKHRLYSISRIRSILHGVGFDVGLECCVLAPTTYVLNAKTREPLCLLSVQEFEDVSKTWNHLTEPDAVYVWSAKKRIPTTMR